jgi:hypothetical protein
MWLRTLTLQSAFWRSRPARTRTHYPAGFSVMGWGKSNRAAPDVIIAEMCGRHASNGNNILDSPSIANELYVEMGFGLARQRH